MQRTLPCLRPRGRDRVAQRELHAGGCAFSLTVLYMVLKPTIVSLLFLPSRGFSRRSASRVHCKVCNTLVRQYWYLTYIKNTIVRLTSLKPFMRVVPLRPSRSHLMEASAWALKSVSKSHTYCHVLSLHVPTNDASNFLEVQMESKSE